MEASSINRQILHGFSYMDVVFLLMVLKNPRLLVVVGNHVTGNRRCPRARNSSQRVTSMRTIFILFNQAMGLLGVGCVEKIAPQYIFFYWKKAEKLSKTFDVVLDDLKFEMQVLLQ